MARARRRSAARAASGWRSRDAQRRLAAVYELKGEREAAFAARRVAADTFAAADRPADAALERLAMANHRRVGADYGEAIELARAAAAEAGRAGARRPARPRARARGRRRRPSAASSRTGLADRPRRARARARARPHRGRRRALPAARARALRLGRLPPRRGGARHRARPLPDRRRRRAPRSPASPASSTCCASAASGRGTSEMCRELIDAGSAAWVAEGLLGAIHGFQGKLSAARRMLVASLATSEPLGHYNMSIDSIAGARATSRPPRARTTRRPSTAASCSSAGRTREDHHFAVWGLRWASGFFAGRGDRAGAHACAEALTRIASDHRPSRRAAPRSPTRSARPRCSTATATPPPSSSPARSSSTAGSTSRSSAPRSSCAPASRWPPPASARPRSSASAAPTAPRASSAPARWRPRPRPRSRRSATRSSRPASSEETRPHRGASSRSCA